MIDLTGRRAHVIRVAAVFAIAAGALAYGQTRGGPSLSPAPASTEITHEQLAQALDQFQAPETVVLAQALQSAGLLRDVFLGQVKDRVATVDLQVPRRAKRIASVACAALAGHAVDRVVVRLLVSGPPPLYRQLTECRPKA